MYKFPSDKLFSEYSICHEMSSTRFHSIQ